MKKITNILFLLIGFNSIAQQTLPLNKLERGTNGQIPMCAPSGTINGVLQMYTPTLTVINGTISGSPINGTLTIPTQSTTIQQAINNDPTVNGLLAQSTNSYVTVSVNPNSYNFRLDDGVDITEMNMSSNLIQFLGDVTINGNEALTTTNTTTVTNKTIESPTITTSTKLDYATANRLTYTDAIKNLKSVILGSGLSLSSGTLSATTTASTTTITGSTNVTVSGSAPNYTISSTPTLAISGQSLSISGGNTITIPTGTLTTSYIGYGDGSNNITGSSSLTYSNSILKINPANLPSGETAPLQLGADKMLIGNTSSALNTPSFIEFIKSTGSGTAATMRGSMGYLGASEMNQSVNMDYTTGTHKYYDPTKVAVWSYLGNTNGFGVQYVPANNPNSNIYVNYGCRPFYMEYINQPATGKGINKN